MKETIVAASALAVVLILACFTQPIEEKWFGETAAATGEAAIEGPPQGTLPVAPPADEPAAKAEDELFTSC